MHEPIYQPQLNTVPVSLAGVRFGIEHTAASDYTMEQTVDPLHIHDYLEIFFNIEGEVSFLVGDRLYTISPGYGVISRPNDVHVCIFDEVSVQEHYCLWIDMEKESPLARFFENKDVSPLFPFDSATHDALRSLYVLCGEEGRELEKTALLLQILTIFEREQQPHRGSSNIPENFQTILDDIDKNYTRLSHVKLLFDRYHVSPATLNRWFRKYVHASAREYIESKKLSHAVKLLTEGCTVVEACMRSGFSDCSHFIVLFKKKFGRTPLQYKREHQS